MLRFYSGAPLQGLEHAELRSQRARQIGEVADGTGPAVQQCDERTVVAPAPDLDRSHSRTRRRESLPARAVPRVRLLGCW